MDIKKQFLACMNQFKATHSNELFTDPAYYQEWLAQTYFFVRHSTALLGYSLPFLKNDPLRHHFENHLGEETKHDLVALSDLKKMGRDISEFSEASSTKAFYQSQYYRIQFEGGTALLGYILFLEGLAVYWGKEVHEEIKFIHKGTNFLRVHAEEDPAHLDAALNTIVKLSLAEQKIIMDNLQCSSEMYGSILTQAKKTYSHRKAA